ncbi:MAG: hypothetical protein A3G45_00625 [Candidatus Staskawiczbacteria bacterium RIFCSPLOWO2_12_FULL_37_15]|uniref:Uncharacterized protein n=1 Tax=Candidatus Staskawiczbacteria bacterium RIFCSPLOWO2_12_FULL_37_15 TaxID=1802218 RepID=A0A1G2IS03_9BACT|nr:MAG: hypothetical protein US35_C0012G0015 [Parcubacteria group bacterium GW2011_GWA2_37_10]OGZ77402.1 MAG: hypothetical protein A3G45_00625 [Candidatus Staskawiczbacteria bacterium RIFCSPLOWO2_12_FULL_37_15]
MNKKNEKGFAKNVVIIIAILVVVFLSQQPYFRGYGKDIYNKAESQIALYWSRASDWVKADVYPRIGGEVAKRGEAIKEEVDKGKNNIAQNIWDKIENYFAGLFSKSTGAQAR